jgi:PAS domain S-box-containing protein
MLQKEGEWSATAVDRSSLDRVWTAAEALTDMGTWEVDVASTRLVWSDGMYRIHGLDAGEVDLTVDVLIEVTHPEDRPRLEGFLRRVLKRPREIGAETVTTEYRIMRPDGSVRQIRVRGQMELDEQRRPLRWTGSAQDVTEQRLTERELHAHYAVSCALSDWESFDRGIWSLLRRLGTALDFPIGVFWAWEERVQRIVCKEFWTAPGVDTGDFERTTRSMSFRPGQGIPGQVWQTHEPEPTGDLRDSLVPPRRLAAAEIGLKTGVSFPAVSNGQTLGVLSFYSFDRRHPTDRQVRTLAGIGADLGRFLDRRRAELQPHRLSDREMEVLRLAADGNRVPEIAARLVLSKATVKTHFDHIYEKLGVNDRAGAVAQGFRLGLLH